MRRLALLATLGLGLAAAATAQNFTFEDVSPDSSTHDPVDPNGATGGRVNGIAASPFSKSVLYAASEFGGIYKSTDGGRNWARLDGHRPTVTWDVEVDPGNASRIYATSFYDGRTGPSFSGINVSNNSGSTWTRPATATPPAGFCAIAADRGERTAFGIGIDPTNPAKVYIGTSCGLAVSNDSGASWSYTSPVAGAGRIWDVVVSADGSAVDTCGDDGHQYLATATGVWTAGSGLPSGMCSIAASPVSINNVNMLATVGLKIYETTNGGVSWFETRTNPRPQGRIPFVATNLRDGPGYDYFDLWFGDTKLHGVGCDPMLLPSPACGFGNSPPWAGPFTKEAGGHDDMGDVLFDPTVAIDACPILMSSDGGVYYNTKTVFPSCSFPNWEQPDVSPHALFPWAMAGADRPGTAAEDLYYGLQDNGVFGTMNAGAGTPVWENEVCCDGFDTAAEETGGGVIIYSVCCSGGGGRRTTFYRKGAGFSGGGQIDYPPSGLPPDFQFPDAIDNWAPNKYVMVTKNCTPGQGGCPGADGGVFITQNAAASPIVWTELGNASEPPSNQICGVKAATNGPGVPAFYVQTGTCKADTTTDRLFRFIGTNPSNSWTEITLPQGGIGIFTVNRKRRNQLLAAGFTASDAFMYMSINSGASWTPLPALDALMDGGGDFPIKNQRGRDSGTSPFLNGYHQPSLVAIDPEDPDLMVAGGRDSGVFVSLDGGGSWKLVSDPRDSHTSGVPHIPRPWHAYFDNEPTGKSIYLTSQGRGIWRLEPANCPNDRTISNNTIGGTKYYAARDTVTLGPALTLNGADIEVQGGETVRLRNNTSISGTFEAGNKPLCPP